MKKNLLPLLMLLSLSSVAQSKFAIGLLGSVDRCRLAEGYNGPSSLSNFYTQAALGYQTGFRVRWDVSEHYTLHTGFSLVSHTLRSEKIPIFSGMVPSNAYPRSVQQEEVLKSFHIPLLCSFYFGKQWRFGMTIGAAYNVLYKSELSATFYYDTKTETQTNSYKISSGNQFLSAIAGVGTEYHLPHWIFRLEPTFHTQVLFFDNKSANENYRFWSAGVALSTFYRF